MKSKKIIKPMGLNFAAAERALIEALKLANDGDALCEASDELKEVVRSVREHGGKGTLKLTVEVSGEGKAVALKVTVTSSKPRAKRPSTRLFADEHGYLGLYDPDQYITENLLDEAANSKAMPPATTSTATD